MLILTEWEEFANLDLSRLRQELKYPIVIDGRNLYDPEVMAAQGFTYYSVGRAAAHPDGVPAAVSRNMLKNGKQGMREKRAVVTGGAGFLGSHLCDALLGEGWNVVAVDNLITGRRANLHHLRNDSRFEFVEKDICEPFDPGRVDYVFHFASPASPVDYMLHGMATLKVGSLGTFHSPRPGAHSTARNIWSHPPPSATAIRWNIRRPKPTGAM